MEIIAKPNDLSHHPRKADGVLPRRTPAFPAHHLVHRSRRAGWGAFSCFSLKSTPLLPRGEGTWKALTLKVRQSAPREG